MQLDLIDTFLDLLDSGSFSRTAERLGVTQSTVSDRIRSLETTVGSVLFERGRAGAQATAAGLRFASYARSIKLSWKLAQQELGHLHRFTGTLRIAAQVSLMKPLLFGWVARLRTAMPDASIHVEADYSPQMIADIVAGVSDVGVVYTPRYFPEVIYEQIFTERFQLVSTTASDLAGLDPHSYIRVGYSPAFNVAHSELLAELSLAPLSVGLGSLAVDFMQLQGGSAYLPRAAAGELIESGAFHLVTDAPQISQPVFVAFHIRKKHDAVVRKALNILRSIAATLDGDENPPGEPELGARDKAVAPLR
jgi:DNA-binding transcriptional LysR family regulator